MKWLEKITRPESYHLTGTVSAHLHTSLKHDIHGHRARLCHNTSLDRNELDCSGPNSIGTQLIVSEPNSIANSIGTQLIVSGEQY